MLSSSIPPLPFIFCLLSAPKFEHCFNHHLWGRGERKWLNKQLPFISSHRPWCRFCEYGDVLGALFILLPQPALHSSARAAPSLSQHPHTELSFGLWQDLSLEQCISSHFQILLSRLKRSPESHHPQGWKKSRITPLIWFLGCLNFLSSGLACCCFFPFVRSYSAKNVPRLISLTLLTLLKSFSQPAFPFPVLSGILVSV